MTTTKSPKDNSSHDDVWDGTDDEVGPEDDVEMSFWDHVSELRHRMIRAALGVAVGFGLSFVFVEELLDLLKEPLRVAWSESGLPGAPQLQVLEIQGALMVDIRVAITSGIFLAAPIIFYQIWGFIAPGLYQREKRFAIPFVVFSVLMASLGAMFAYTFVLPYVMGWLLTYNEGSWVNRLLLQYGGSHREVAYQLELGNYVKGATRLLLAFAAVFEFPMLAAFLAKAGMITHLTLLRHWRIAVLIIFIVAAFLTPPEPVSQMMMAGPMVVLFFASVVITYFINPATAEEIALDTGDDADFYGTGADEDEDEDEDEKRTHASSDSPKVD